MCRERDGERHGEAKAKTKRRKGALKRRILIIVYTPRDCFMVRSIMINNFYPGIHEDNDCFFFLKISQFIQLMYN